MRMQPLAPADLPRAAALSALVGWNQMPADWTLFLRHGAVQAMDDGRPEVLAATAATLPYGSAGPGTASVAWISMVLVRPDLRRRGHATALLRWAVDSLRHQGTGCIALDATPAGREVYRRMGFRDLWGFTRWTLPAALAPERDVRLRPLTAADWPALLDLDRAGFGGARAPVLRGFAARLPGAALVAEDAAGLRGAVLARDGLRGPQLGPVWARDAVAARALVSAAVARLPAGSPPAVLDLRDGAFGLQDWLAAQGGTMERPFTRMVLGSDPAGDPAGFAAVAGPEFG